MCKLTDTENSRSIEQSYEMTWILPDDTTDAILRLVPPENVFCLKLVSLAWYAHVQAFSGDPNWAAWHGLPFSWMEDLKMTTLEKRANTSYRTPERSADTFYLPSIPTCLDEIRKIGLLLWLNPPPIIDLSRMLNAGEVQALVDGGAFRGFLKSIILANNNIDAEAAKVLAPAIRDSGSLTSIDLSRNYLSRNLSRNPTSYTADGITAIAGALSVSGSLTSIDLQGTWLDTKGIQALLEGGAFTGSLTSIDLTQNSLDEEAAKILAPAILDSSLTSIDLSDNNLLAEGAKALVDGGAFRGSLTSIGLLGNKFDDETAMMLLKLKEEKPHLLTLCGLKPDHTEANFSRWLMGPSGAKMLAPEIVRGSLTSIDLYCNELGVEGAAVIAPAIRDSGSLTSANVLGNDFDNEAVSLLLKVKAEKPSLITLCGLALDQTEASFMLQGLGPADAKLLAPEILVRGSLTSINLRHNNLGSEGAEALVKGGAFRGSLTAIDLFDNDLGPEGAKALVDGGAFRGSLSSIDLRSNNLGAKGAKALAGCLKKEGGSVVIDK